jgi:hypothetical protein
MRFLLTILFALVLSGNATASYRMPHDCCPDQACAPHCLAMTCASAAAALAPPVAYPGFTAVMQGSDSPRPVPMTLPMPVEEIWTPPD